MRRWTQTQSSHVLAASFAWRNQSWCIFAIAGTRTQAVVCHKASGSQEGCECGTHPPTFPSVVPLLGSLPIAYLFNPKAFILDRNNFVQTRHPTRVKILHQEFYVVRGPDNVKALFKAFWACTSIPFVKFTLGHAFGLPTRVLSLFDQDDSGGSHSLVRFLEGKGLPPFWNRFKDNITQRLRTMCDHIGSDWDHHPDLKKMVGDEATMSILNALCGPHLLVLNPDFLESFRNFDHNL
ncbi:hypothetical protein F5B22DRAFT_651863 [Xylaria bambusicola]|uniref:uncharacterized protein n=1 Tax=Xylaria bambusicola TaxID=326684 RepID=UPI00200862F1|nr:uncharacterized protein F5B22DRAFT_651863 [Xylaria bambusicola]KAI0505357.1 hypothetical protein F5B22DRAFT_651863 [Xylaria bambusicola]